MRPHAIQLLFLFMTVSCFGQDLKRVDDKDIDQQQVKLAISFARQYYAMYNEDSVLQIGAEATAEMQAGFTADVQRKSNAALREPFGKFENLDFSEAWKKSDYTILRFKAQFANTEKKLEIRVVLDANNKIAGFFIKPWSDMVY